MLQYQSKLPRLPVPPLLPTINKYLLSVQPLLTTSEFLQTKATAEAFCKDEGEKLHNLLLDKASKNDNWLYDWWLNAAYLEYRSPVIIHSSPGLILPSQEFGNQRDVLSFTSRLIAGALDFKKKIDCRELQPEMMGTEPVDMSQYLKIFSTCRIPKVPKDKLLVHRTQQPRHIVVVRNNNYFSLQVYNQSGDVLSESEILAQLKSVVEASKKRGEELGILSTQDRDSWAMSYQRLCKDKNNQEAIDTIEQAIFVVCLDQAPPLETRSKSRMTHLGSRLLHGGGSLANSGNRWFDKTIQFVINEDGGVGLVYEHTPAEAPPVVKMVEYVCEHIAKKSTLMEQDTCTIRPTLLTFTLSQDTKDDIKRADAALNSLISDLDLDCFTFPLFGKRYIKEKKQSPDSFIQMAMQLAFYRLHRTVAPTYESASTRKFLYGRTETIRSASNQSLAFCAAMMSEKASAKKRTELLKAAIKAHKTYTNEAINGLGVDRYLLGLKKVTLENNLPIHDFFRDPGYLRSTHFRLSTSQVASKEEAVMCYGAGVPDGYGCCYNPREEKILFGLSAFNSDLETSTEKFKAALEESLTEMHDTLQMTQSSKL